MFSSVLRPRRVPAVRTGLAVLTVLAMTAACGGTDLGRSNYPRTTVTRDSAGAGSAPDGPITDQAVATSALRTVDPCPLLDATTLAELGTPGTQSAFGLDKCSNEVKDAGGKTIRVSLQLGDSLSGAGKDANGSVEGLPQIERKQDDATCFVTAVTSKEPDLGITAQVSYQGGDPCRPGRVVLQKVIKRLRDKPAQYPQVPGSLLAVDLCTVGDDAVMAEIFGGDVKKSPIGLHNCSWSGRSPSGNLVYRTGSAPTPDGQTKEVDLGGGMKGYSKSRSKTGSQCNITWLHRQTKEGEGEIVSFDYNNYTAEASADDPCGKALKAVKAIVPKLPKG
ncbi:DUF3558 domain-containing protein [Amycolatopsis anabasis]|uniref:DUF3558 domain-containing protein n=1 Tax=Amycolatopsis anabasis TaxID=1840409 RepID=UPI00131EB7E4|nr:DUF3558 domain-containing protein [Amycolatopsis anabasis]